MFSIFLVFLAVFSTLAREGKELEADPQPFGPQCRASVCDDRPECPTSSCRCLFPSRKDCDVYYQCTNGKPFQYRCSPGLLFNNKTLSCDYSYNVDCSINTTPTQSTESLNTTISKFETTTKIAAETTSDYVANDTLHPTVTDEATTTTVNNSTDKTTKLPATTKTEATEESSSIHPFTGMPTTQTPGSKATTIQTEKPSTTQWSTPHYETTATSQVPTKTPEITTITTTKDPTSKTEEQTTDSITTAEKQTTVNKNLTTSGMSSTYRFTTKDETSPYTDITTIVPPSDFICPTRFGLFPDPRSCFRFYHCSHWNAYHKWCPSNLHFNPNLTVCDWPDRAGCAANSTETPSTTSESETTTKDVIETTSHSDGQSDTTTFTPSTSTTTSSTYNFSDITTERTSETIITTNTPAEKTLSTEVMEEHNATSEATEETSSGKRITDIPSTETSQSDTTTAPTEKSSSSHLPTTDKFETTIQPETLSTTQMLTTQSPKYETTTEVEKSTSRVTTSQDPETTSVRAEKTTTESIPSKTESQTMLFTTYPEEQTTVTDNPTTKILTEISTTNTSRPETTIQTESMSTTQSSAQETTATSQVTSKISDTTKKTTAEDSSSKAVPQTTLTSTTAESRTTINENLSTTGITPSKNVSSEDYYTSESETALHSEATTIDHESNFECPTRFGLFPDPDSCFRFYHCSQWIPYRKWCPSGLHFNPSLQVCDWPYRAGCAANSTETPSTTSEPETTTKDVIETTSHSDGQSDTTTFTPSTSTTTSSTYNFSDITTERTSETIITTNTPAEKTLSTEVMEEHNATSEATEETSSGKRITDIPSTETSQSDTTTAPTEKLSSSHLPTTDKFETTIQPETLSTTQMLTTQSPKYETTTEVEKSTSRVTTSQDPETTSVRTEETTTENIPSKTESQTMLFTTYPEEQTTVTDNPTTKILTEISTTNTPRPETTIQTESISTTQSSAQETTATSQVTTKIPDTTKKTTAEDSSSKAVPQTTVSSTTAESRTTINGNLSTTGITPSKNVSSEDYYTSESETALHSEATTIDHESKFECPTRFGLFPDPDSCFRFYHCSHWIPYRKWCPSGLHFNPSLQVCDWPYRAGCDATNQTMTSVDKLSSTSTQPTSEIQWSTSANEFQSCDCGNCSLPIPGECAAHMKCVNNVARKEQCEQDLYFNPMTGACDSQDSDQCTLDVSCQRMGRFLYPGSCSYFYECRNGTKVVRKCPEWLQFNQSTEMCGWTGSCSDAGQLPDQNPSGKIFTNISICEGCSYCFRPYPSQCSRYVRCSQGSASDALCPPGLFFNPSTQLCDHDSNVDCQDPEIHLRCPEFSGFFPYPGECGNYIQCVNGIATVKSCPGILHFDPAKKNCEWPWLADCGNSNGTPTVKPDTGLIDCDCNCCLKPTGDDCKAYIVCIDKVGVQSTCSSGLLFNPETENCESSKNVVCRTISPNVTGLICPEYQGLFPHPEYCTKFIHCDHGVPYVKDCPSDLHFNPQLKVCDWPYSAGCQRGVSTVSPPVEDSGVLCDVCDSCFVPIDGDCAAYMHCLNDTGFKYKCPENLLFNPKIEACDVKNNVECSNPHLQCPKPEGWFPYQECSKFIHCTNGIAYLEDCPDGLHFNSEKLVCDWPETANCGAATSEPPTKIPNNGNNELNRTCSCDCCFFPNPVDCSKYFLCLDGFPYEGKCSSGLLFNPRIDNCDLPARVNCSKSSLLCPEPDGTFWDPDSCSSYVQCSNGTPQKERCTNGTHFSSERHQCMNPCEAKCDDKIDCQTKPSTGTPTTTTSIICLDLDGYYANPNDCSSFVSCSNGEPYTVRCPEGLHYSVEFEICEHPCDAKCDPNFDCSPLSTTKKPPSPFSCPEPEGLYPVIHDCTAFHLCSNGTEHLIHCPPGLHYSVQMETCEHPCLAQCNTSTQCPTSPEPANLSSTALPLSQECPEAVGLFLNPDDCGSFYQCSNGKANLIHCPSGLHFSLEDAACEKPCVAGCDLNITCPTEIPDAKGNCSCEACYLPDPSDCSAFYFCSGGRIEKNYCPIGTLFDKESSSCQSENAVVCEANGDPSMCPEQFGYFLYPGDCKKFLHCDNGVAHVKRCIENLEFDPVNKVCTTPKGYCGDTVMDPHCPEPTGLFPHPTNCSFFYHCEHGVAYAKICSPPLMFNPVDKVCDWPESVDCGKDNTSSQTTVSSTLSQPSSTPNTNQTPSYPTSTTAEPCLDVPGVICPCACRVPTYDECSSFFQCQEDGTACKKYCPEGLYFNKREMVCDLPTNVECRDFFFTSIRRIKYFSHVSRSK